MTCQLATDRKSGYLHERVTGENTLAEIFAVVAERSRDVAPHLRWIACVDVNPEHSKGRMLFAEAVAVQRGVNVRVFSTVADAGQWLRGQLKSRAI
jgi:hypothetical protein